MWWPMPAINGEARIAALVPDQGAAGAGVSKPRNRGKETFWRGSVLMRHEAIARSFFLARR